MNLIYIDESGNTGLNFKDTQQPIFLLVAIIIPESKWFSLEQEFFGIAKKYFKPVLPEPFEIHAADLVSRRGIFRQLTFEECLSFRNEILHLLLDNQIVIIYRRIIKSKFEVFCEKHYGKGIKINPYIMALPFVCIEVDHYLVKKGENELGILIFDEQKENWDDVERSLRTLRLDSDSILKTNRIIEKGFSVSSAKSFGLQLVDLAAYYIRKYEEDRLGIKKAGLYNQQTFECIKGLSLTGVGSKMEDILEWVKQNLKK